MKYVFGFFALSSFLLAGLSIWIYTPQNSVVGLLAIIGVVTGLGHTFAAYKEY